VILLTACLTALALGAGEPAAALDATPVARVDGLVVTRGDLVERLRALALAGRTGQPRAALDDLVDEALLAAEARRRGLAEDRAVRAQVDAERRRLAVEAMLDAETSALPPPPEAELRAAYHATADAIRLVLVKVAAEADAKALLARVRAGADLAKEASASLDPNLAARGGDTGRIIRGALEPSLQEAAFAAPLGQPFGPVALKLGWAVGRVTERQVAAEEGFEPQRPRLLAQARQQRREFVRKHLVERLSAAPGVSVDEAWLKALDPTKAPSPADLAHVVARTKGRTIAYQAIWPSLRDLAAVGRGHMAGRGTRVALVRKELEKALLEEAAAARGLEQSPAVTGTLRAIERNLLASELAVRLTGSRDAGLLDPPVRDLLATLRAKASITLDPAALRPLTTP
jgi:peptidyl-prolyl cis-trans isomerase C